MAEVTSINPDDRWRVATERRLAALELLQGMRREAIARRIEEMNAVFARHQRVIDNLRATLEAGE